MKIIMYGAEICPDCVQAKELLKEAKDIELDYRNITESTRILKEFLAYRDHEELFHTVKEEGRIGIPFFLYEDGTKSLELPDVLVEHRAAMEQPANSCSIDGKGNC